MKLNPSLLFSVILLAWLAGGTRMEAATYTVKAGGGGNYSTIQACANVALAGDTCLVYAGTYGETVSLPSSGSSGSPIVFAVNPGDCVTVSGWKIGARSYITIGTPGSTMCTNGGFTYSGFEITGGTITYSNGSSYWTIQNNYIHDTTSGSRCIDTVNYSSDVATYASVLNNIITACGGVGATVGQGLHARGNHWLIDGNTISHVEDGMSIYCQYCVVRNNHFGPEAVSDYPPSNHPDGLESSCGTSTEIPLQHMLYENNVLQEWHGPNAHGFLLRDTPSPPCGQSSNIIRLSTHIDSGSYFTVTQTSSLNEYFYNLSISNTELDIGTKQREDFGLYNGSINGRSINNIFTNETLPNSVDWCIYDDATSTGLVEHHNLCFMSGYAGSWQGPSYSGGNTYSSTDIFNRDPKFVNPTGDLHLQAGSPAIGAGGSLTNAVGSGSSTTSLTVADAGFFSDGYGIPNVQPDWIRIGASTTVQISSVNYSTNVITLASAASWNNNDPIYLYKDSNGRVVLFGNAPDIGAYPYQSAPAPPTNLTAVPQ